jgi:hypothetical protein
MALRGTLPVAVKDATRRRVRRAAELKSKHAIAYADAFAVATVATSTAASVCPHIFLGIRSPGIFVGARRLGEV